MANKYEDGVFYSFVDRNGKWGFGWTCREDSPDYSEINPWIDALRFIQELFADKEGLSLYSLVRCSHRDAMRMVKEFEQG